MGNYLDRKPTKRDRTNDRCEFCLEIQGLPGTTFSHIYEAILANRIIEDSSNFVALPTIGQLFKGSLLILPKLHFQTFATIPGELRSEAMMFIDRIAARARIYGNVFMFEHGAHSQSGGACGMYHAHIHLIPLPGILESNELMRLSGQRTKDLNHAWSEVMSASEYLVIRDTSGSVVCFTNTASQRAFESQFVRRRLADHYKLDRPWDWRSYDAIEPDLVSTYTRLRVPSRSRDNECA